MTNWSIGTQLPRYDLRLLMGSIWDRAVDVLSIASALCAKLSSWIDREEKNSPEQLQLVAMRERGQQDCCEFFPGFYMPRVDRNYLT